jgi:hypothetical protein
MISKNPRPLTQPEPGDLNHGKASYQPGSLHTTDLPMQPSLKEQMQRREPVTCKTCEHPSCMQRGTTSNAHTVCTSNLRRFDSIQAFDPHSCILCDHVIVQKILGNKCGKSGSLCCNLKECPIEARKRREAIRPVLPDKTCDPSCPCRTPVCEQTCPQYQFKERFCAWLAVNYPSLDIASHQDIVDNASGLFDEFWADRS